MNTAPAIQAQLATPSASAVSVATRDLHLAFGRNKVLRGVDLEVPAGTAACIIGPSGSGKSTLLRCVNRLLEPDSGEVLIAGRSVMGDDPDVLRQRIGMVFQHFNLFPHKSVLANITLGLRKLRGLSREEADAAALTQLDRVDLRHKAHVRPGTLSGGQQQRVAIARTLAMSPEVMLFDEATSALDPELVKGRSGHHRRPGGAGHDDARGHPRDGVRPRAGRHGAFHGRWADRRVRPARAGSRRQPAAAASGSSCPRCSRRV